MRRPVAMGLAGGILLTLWAGAAWGRSDETNRMESHVLVLVSPLGFQASNLAVSPLLKGNITPVESTGGEGNWKVGYVLQGGHWVVGLERGNSFFRITSPLTSDKASLSALNVGAFARYYMGNSFYLNLMMNERTHTGDSTFSYTNTGTGVLVSSQGHFKAQAQSVSVGFGNQWIMDNGLILDMEWVVLSKAVGKRALSSIQTTGTYNGVTTPLTAADLATLEGYSATLTQTINHFAAQGGLFIFSAGWAF
ncbi:MAG: hypothetical protein OEV94_09045 [Deltaproteobacteria bacterium]|nr:hypothetical protein [Deltaproteobacteria bacterium]